jgi:hypothetical protein
VSPFHLFTVSLETVNLISVHSRQSEPDAREITYLLNRYWDKIDINRIPEQDMNDFAAAIPDASRAWASLQKKYGI